MSKEMYGRRAWLYDLIYSNKDYAAESRALHQLLAEHGVEDGAAVLEAACGTGNYLEHLHKYYDAAGFDLSAEMVAIARAKLPDAKLFTADMVDFTTARPYDALLCLFSSISYVDSLGKLTQTAQTFGRALRPGGVVIVEPWVGPDDYKEGRPSMKTYADDTIKVCRQFVGQREGRRATLEFHWLVAQREREVDYFTEKLVAYLYTVDEYRAAFEAAGFAVSYDPEGLNGRGLFVGVRV